MASSPQALLCPDTDGHFLPSCIVLCWARGQNVLLQYEWVQSLNTHCFSLSHFLQLLSPSHWLMPHDSGKLPAHILPNQSGKIVHLCEWAKVWGRERGVVTLWRYSQHDNAIWPEGKRGRWTERQNERKKEMMRKIYCFLPNVLGNKGCRDPRQ